LIASSKRNVKKKIVKKAKLKTLRNVL